MRTQAISPLDNEPIAKRSLTVFILVDVSRSMRGNKLRTVNSVMNRIVPELRDVGGSDADVRMAVMSFSDDCHWMFPSPVPVESFEWTELEAGGWTCLGKVCLELDHVMSRKRFLDSPSLSFAPVVILLSDGGPTDKYEEALYTLNGNKWFRHSLKVAIAIGQKAKVDKLAMFIGDPEAVIRTFNAGSLSEMLKLVVLRSSEIASRSMPLEDVGSDPDKAKQQRLIHDIREMAENHPEDIDSGW